MNANIGIIYNKQIIVANEDLNMSLVLAQPLRDRELCLAMKNNTDPDKIKDNFV